MRLAVGNHELLSKMVLAYLKQRDPSKCLLWPRGKQKGYGAIRIGKRIYRAHRLAYEMAFGRLSESCESDICHTCDTPACVNPDHLFAGTATDNMQDCARKGRTRKGKKQVQTQGERNPRSKLTDEIVMEMRRMAAAGEKPRHIYRKFGVAYSTVRRVLIGEYWSHVA